MAAVVQVEGEVFADELGGDEVLLRGAIQTFLPLIVGLPPDDAMIYAVANAVHTDMPPG